jgi:hypothetical protein
VRRTALAGAFFVAAAAFLHREILAAPSARLIGGYQAGAIFAWTFWWWRHALENGLPLFRTSLLMYPSGAPLFSMSPVNDAAGLLLRLVLSPTAVVNALMVAHYALAGTAAFVLFDALAADAAAALCGAFAFAFSYYSLVQHVLGQLNEAAIFAAPLFALALERLRARPTRSAALAAGAAFLALLLSGPYAGLYFGGLLLSLRAVFGLDRRVWRRLAGPIAAAAVLAGAAYWPMLRRMGEWAGGARVYSTALASFWTQPYWNERALLRPAWPAASANPEEVMGYLGLLPLFLVAYTLADRRLRSNEAVRFWWAVLASSAVLTLGPWLSVEPGRALPVPLPYLLARVVPGLGAFRTASRFMMTAALASGALAALALARLLARRPAWLRWSCACAFVGFWCWDFDVAKATRQAAPAVPSAVYRRLREERDSFAVLELPAGYDRHGDLFYFAQRYMLYQTFHGHPMVLGTVGRYLPEGLEFTERTPWVREAVHPWLLPDEPDRVLAARGAALLRGEGIKYVVYHEELQVFDAATRARLLRWVETTLGPPLLVDGGERLYRAGPA